MKVSRPYEIRLGSTAFPNLYAPIITSLTGLVTKKEPDIDGLSAFDTSDVDGHGGSLHSFIKQVCESSMVAGVEFVSVESDIELGTTFFKRYQYEQLVSYQMLNGKLSNIVFKDEFEKADGEFGVKTLSRYIVFKIGGGSVWYDDGDGLTMMDEWENSLPDIPVVSIRTGKELSKFDIIPRFYDVVAMSRVMLSLETQLANVLAVVGNPIPIFYGSPDDDGNGLQIGVRDAMVFEDKQAGGFEYAEIKGGGVDKLQDKLKKVSDDIDKISFGVLRKDDTSTVIEAQENQNKSSSFLSDVAEELEAKFTSISASSPDRR
ncbi:MAG: DUF4055 domain-containing protein [Candidatus Methanofishera endochildressiae]|uniref:DUF4055 domain-containing protein n=1 Tax=Candidatus Methanofishera endochildressiae TaxID=2738884 RepID=A0A7Z0MPV1_9GAMM|nr:DUF4055 domain-containing protein [Candidatus Methanofishera endochildressiae]